MEEEGIIHKTTMKRKVLEKRDSEKKVKILIVMSMYLQEKMVILKEKLNN